MFVHPEVMCFVLTIELNSFSTLSPVVSPRFGAKPDWTFCSTTFLPSDLGHLPKPPRATACSPGKMNVVMANLAGPYEV